VVWNQSTTCSDTRVTNSVSARISSPPSGRNVGFEVRLQTVAGGSLEDSPPTVLEFIRRDLRWCQGNLQYLRLLATPGLRPVSRFQLCWAILMFISIPAWTLMIALLPVAAWCLHDVRVAWLGALHSVYMPMYLSPKLAGSLHPAASGRLARYGGRPRFSAGVVCELVFSSLQFAVTSLHVSGFIAAMMLGRSARWSGQVRDTRTVFWHKAARALWPQTLFGVALHGALLAIAPAILPWALLFTLGYLMVIPFAVVSASPAFDRWCVRRGLFAVPEEGDPPVELAALWNGTR
jgi:membrane glycosyltransferase